MIMNFANGTATYKVGDAEGSFSLKGTIGRFSISSAIATSGLLIDDLQIYTTGN